MKFRRKPETVEATQWFKDGDHPAVVSGPLYPASPFRTDCHGCGRPSEEHGTMTGEMLVSICPGTWLIEHPDGYLLAQPKAFERDFEAVEDPRTGGNVWACRIGEVDAALLPPGSDAPMRRAVEDAYIALTGKEPTACFSGWGERFTKSERDVFDRQDGGETASKR